MGKKDRNNVSIIDKEFKIDGSISSTGQLIIRGQVTGTIEGDIVIIAEDGVVNSSSTKVSSLTIGGNFKGDVAVSKELIILATGICAGKVECQDLIVEKGGVLNAEVSCKISNRLAPGKESASFVAGFKKEKNIEL